MLNLEVDRLANFSVFRVYEEKLELGMVAIRRFELLKSKVLVEF